MSDFNKAFEYMLKNEGGFANDKADRGGATRYGITRATASKWRGHSVSVEQMKNFELSEAKEIYREWYWWPLSCDDIENQSIATAMFDIGVVCGIGTSAKMAQLACVGLTVDGDIGPKTIAALNAIDAELFIMRFRDLVAARFKAIAARNESQRKFLKGWLNRADRLLTLGDV